MIKKLLLIVILISTVACSSVKKTQKAINYGNYDEAINIALNHLKNNKSKKSNQEYIVLLEDAYKKSTEKDLATIAFLEKDANPSNLEKIFTTYLKLKQQQEQIKPLLPLPIVSKKRNAVFLITDYTEAIIATKNKLSEYLYVNANQLIANATNKLDFRVAFDDLHYLNQINPNYKDVKIKMEQAHINGSDYILVSLKNKTNQVIPKRLEDDLLNFNTYNLNDFWTVFEVNKQPNFVFDYEMEILFTSITISPEEIHEKEVVMEKQIIDGWQYLKDKDNQFVKDSLGNKIKIDVYKNISCKFTDINQNKAAQVVGLVRYFNLNSNQLLKEFPLKSQFIFKNRFGRFRGDKKALDKNQLDLITNKFIPFPSNEQMIFDCGEDLKAKIKSSINSIVSTN